MIVKGKGNYKGSAKKNFTITAKDLKSVHMRAEDVIYTGKAGKYISKPVLMDDNSMALTSSDYGEITYSVNGKVLGKKDNPELGSVITVTVKGKGNYTGTASTTYKLCEGKKFSSARITVKAKAYTGRQVEIAKDDVTVTYNGATLTYGKDYEIVEHSYKNNIKKGTATVAIKGCGDYVGEKTVKFSIKSMETK